MTFAGTRDRNAGRTTRHIQRGADMKRILVFFLLGAFLSPADAQSPPAGLPDQPHVIGRGHGEVKVSPDTASMDFDLMATGKTSEEVADALDSQAARVTELLRSMGVKADDIRASNVSIGPDYRCNGQHPENVARRGTRNYSVTLRDLSQFPDFLRKLTELDVGRLGAIRFSTSKEKTARREALRKAIADARAQAELMAEGAGASIRTVYSVSESGPDRGPLEFARMSSQRNGQAYLVPSFITLDADVTVVYLITP
jgi:hypothetical protein